MADLDPSARERLRTAARQAVRHGAKPELWREWLALVDSLGVPRAAALDLLPRDALRWLAKFHFADGDRDAGLDAYARLLDGNAKGQWIFEGEAAAYFSGVRAARGPTSLVDDAWPRFAEIDPDGYASRQVIVADAESEIGRVDAALGRLRALVRRCHTEADLHAALARHARAAGLVDEADARDRAAARRRSAVTDFGSSAFRGAGLAFLAAPGLTLLPGDGPHTYGGDAFDTPPCPGCGQHILLLATIDTADAVAQGLTSLAPLVGRLPRLPILHCDRCELAFSLPDYRIAEDGRRIEVFNHGSLAKNAVLPSDARPAEQSARLVAPTVPALNSMDDEAILDAIDVVARQRAAGPQVGGVPQPINASRRRFCPQCEVEQIFYAAFCEAEAFATNVCVNPDGYCYWFACPACRIVSTEIDNT